MNPMPLAISQVEKRFLMESAFILRQAQRTAEASVIYEALVPLVEEKQLPLVGLGSIHFEAGEFEKAVEYYERATEHEPRSALAFAHLGEALAFAGQRDEASLVLEKASKLDPKGDNGGEFARSVQKFLAYGFL